MKTEHDIDIGRVANVLDLESQAADTLNLRLRVGRQRLHRLSGALPDLLSSRVRQFGSDIHTPPLGAVVSRPEAPESLIFQAHSVGIELGFLFGPRLEQ
jgi:hypothetical protein